MSVTRVNITLDTLTLDTLDAIERATGASRSEIIRRAVAAFTAVSRKPAAEPSQPKNGRDLTITIAAKDYV